MNQDPDHYDMPARPPAARGEGISRAVVGVVTLTVLLAAWCVVALSLVLLYRAGSVHGLGDLGAAMLAAPAAFVPAWISWSTLRAGSGLTGALVSHLWVLNGSVGYLALVLSTLAVADAAKVYHAAGRLTWPLALAGVTGFLVMLAGMVIFNLWLSRRITRRVAGASAVPPETR